jgi:hypothetical protein
MVLPAYPGFPPAAFPMAKLTKRLIDATPPGKGDVFL